MTGYSGCSDADNSHNKYLIFLLGESRYGIPILHMTEIIRMQPLTPLPESPEHVRGIISLRDRVIPVMDLAGRLGRSPADEESGRACILILSLKDRPVGFLVEGIEGVQDFLPEDIAPAPRTQSTDLLITGFGKRKDDLIFLLDASRLVAGDFSWMEQ